MAALSPVRASILWSGFGRWRRWAKVVTDAYPGETVTYHVRRRGLRYWVVGPADIYPEDCPYSDDPAAQYRWSRTYANRLGVGDVSLGSWPRRGESLSFGDTSPEVPPSSRTSCVWDAPAGSWVDVWWEQDPVYPRCRFVAHGLVMASEDEYRIGVDIGRGNDTVCLAPEVHVLSARIYPPS